MNPEERLEIQMPVAYNRREMSLADQSQEKTHAASGGSELGLPNT